MDRRRIELQLRIVLVTYRIERRRRDSQVMQAFRERGRAILEDLAAEVAAFPDLEKVLIEARAELSDQVHQQAAPNQDPSDR